MAQCGFRCRTSSTTLRPVECFEAYSWSEQVRHLIIESSSILLDILNSDVLGVRVIELCCYVLDSFVTTWRIAIVDFVSAGTEADRNRLCPVRSHTLDKVESKLTSCGSRNQLKHATLVKHERNAIKISRS